MKSWSFFKCMKQKEDTCFSIKKELFHTSVLSKELIEIISPQFNDVIVDCTLGGGGHSRIFLQKGAKVIGLDCDGDAIRYARSINQDFSKNLSTFQINFSDIKQVLKEEGVSQVQAIVADLGVSSHQLNTAKRGFSFQLDGPLDMRMSDSISLTAEDILHSWSKEDLSQIFYEYGEEKKSRFLAKAIVDRRKKKAFRSTLDLSDFISSLSRGYSRKHPATRIFQALRITVNDELGQLQSLLKIAPQILAPQGKLAIISFHSLEDRLVKQSFKEMSTKYFYPINVASPIKNEKHFFTLLTKKPILPSSKEISQNLRARSAKLRVVERIQEQNICI